MAKTSRPSATGLAIDPSGGVAVDPTQNVKDLMEASFKSLAREAELQATIANEKIHRMEVRVDHAEQISVLRAEHGKEMRYMEADRIDKIRSVDVANAASTAAQLLSAVNNLATTAAATTETLRNQVATTAAASAASLAALINPIVERVAGLEKSSYTGAGKSAVSDPAMAELVAEMRKLTAASGKSEGKSQGIGIVGAVVMGAVSIISALLGIAGVLYAVLAP